MGEAIYERPNRREGVYTLSVNQGSVFQQPPCLIFFQSYLILIHSITQVAVLKEEIRRLERNAERQGANLEYLKNVVVKYMESSSAVGKDKWDVCCLFICDKKIMWR